MANTQEQIDKLIHLYFKQNNNLYEHLFSSYNQFIEEIIPYILTKEGNPIYVNIQNNIIYMHLFKIKNIRFKPSTHDNDNEYKFPDEARKNHLNYTGTIIADVSQNVEIENILTGEKTVKEVYQENDIAIGNIPIMIKSKYCSTYINKDLHNECKFDSGGYFLIKGQEKVIMSIEKKIDNKILVFSKKDTSYPDGQFFISQIISRKNDWSDNLQILTIKNRKDGVFTISTPQLIDIPLFIILRAMSLESDEDIVANITNDLTDIKMINLLRPSIDYCHDENNIPIKTREEALNYLVNKINRNRRMNQTDEAILNKQKMMTLENIIKNDLLQHLGNDIPKKRVFICLMINKLLAGMLGRVELDDRDALHNKRIETPGILLGQLFKQNWKKTLSEISKNFRKSNHNDIQPNNVIILIKPTIIEQGITTALSTGIWGLMRTKTGVAQAMLRLSWTQAASYLRRILTPSLDSSNIKITSMRQVNNSQYKFLCCVTGDTNILLSNNMNTKIIKNMDNSDNVLTVNQQSLITEESGINNFFELIPDELFEIVTNSGRKIKATRDHPFLIKIINDTPFLENNLDWLKLEELKINDQVIIMHTEQNIQCDKLTVLDIINATKEVKILDHYKEELHRLGLLYVNIQNDKLKIIARLIGLINTDSCLDYISLDNKNYYHSYFILKEEYDLEQLLNDITDLGFKRDSYIITKYEFLNAYYIDENCAFSYLLYLCGGFCGKKDQTTKIVPKWLLEADLSVKREFLSSFQSSNDSSNLLFNKNNDIIEAVLSKTILSTTESKLEEILAYSRDICNMFLELNINCFIKDKHINYERTDVYIYFDNYLENLNTYCNVIGNRYNKTKKLASIPVIEFLKIKEFNIKENKINNDILLLSNNEIYDNFIKSNILDNGCMAVYINSIKNIEIEPVYDFTTNSSNHSFVASSFVTHNCIETPEGQKVGVVKSLAMMSTITIQNVSQEKIVDMILESYNNILHPADINPLTMNDYVKIFINGNWIGVTEIKYCYDLYILLKQKKRDHVLDKHISILLDFSKKEIRIYSDAGRLIRPLLIVNSENDLNLNEDIIKAIDEELKKTDINKSWKRILSLYNDIIEYEDIESCNFLMVADKVINLEEAKNNKKSKIDYSGSSTINRYGDYRWVRFTHCEFHGWLMLGTSSATVPFLNHDYATKNIVFFSQVKQSIGIYLSSYKDRMDISQILYHPQIPLVQTKAMEYNNMLDLPYGENVIIAIMSYTGYNQEDSLVFNQSAIDRGIFRVDSLKKYSSKIQKNPSTSLDDIFCKPDSNTVTNMKQAIYYNKLNDDGYVPEETEIHNNDIIIGKISPIQATTTSAGTKTFKDSSEIFKSNVTGVIDRVHTGVFDSEGYQMYNVRVRMERTPIVGDKFCLLPDTQVLTSIGFIPIKSITLTHKVACLSNKQEIYYTEPTELFKFNHQGKMYKIKNNDIQLTTTLTHKMYVKKNDIYELLLAKDIIDKNVYYKKNGINNKKDKIETYKKDGLELTINDYLTAYSHAINLNLNKNSYIRFSKTIEIYELINEFIDFPHNYLSNCMLTELSQIQSKFLLDKIFNFRKEMIIENYSLIDEISILALNAGTSIDIIGNTIKLVENNEPLATPDDNNIIDYDGNVYCITVPEHIFYVRENGKSCWTGNSSRHGQKGTLGIALPQRDMPFTEEGMVPDIIMNPHCIPSRMTIGQLVECLASKQAAVSGRFIDGTPFNDYDVTQLPIILAKLGYSPSGTEKMYCGLTGKLFESEIFIGPTYELRLKHMVQDKVHGRARGPRHALTRQPLEGRTRDGGFKIGEMERDSMISHGIGQFIKERMMECSDISKLHICNICGLIASKCIGKDYYSCKACENTKQISCVVVGYAFKLLIQELMSVNILPRIRTETEIDNYADEI